MALLYCDLCGAQLTGPGVDTPDGAICPSCLSSRQAIVTPQHPLTSSGEILQFDCCYCRSLLRLKRVSRRTRVRCPKCDEGFYLHEDGHVEAKLEGSKTAVIQQDEVAPLTKVGRGPMKTQPISRTSIAKQRAMLEELKPKTLGFVESLERADGPLIDPANFDARPPSALGLLPEGVGPGQAEAVRAEMVPDARLRASDEGRVELGASELKKKTERHRKQAVQAKFSAEERKAQREQRGRERRERDRRLEEAERRGREVQEQRTKKTLSHLVLWLLFLLPLLVSLGLAGMSERGTGFANRGRLGQGLEQMGRQIDTGVKTLNGFLPQAIRLPIPEDE